VERQQLFDIAELSTLSYRCIHCGTVIVFRMDTDEQFGIPKRCSTCMEPLGPAAQAFVDYRTFYRGVLSAKVPMRLHAFPSKESDL